MDSKRNSEAPERESSTGLETAHPRSLHPSTGSSLNPVEVCSATPAIRRSDFGSVRDLMIKIRALIGGWNRRKHPPSGPSPFTKIIHNINRNVNVSQGRATRRLPSAFGSRC
jgi:hypothetical protein